MDRNSFYDNLANYSKNSLHSNGINLHDSSKIDFYNYIEHHGIKGQKWGVRRYQNPDGSLTEEGKQRYLNPDGSLNRQGQKELGREGVAKFNQQRQQQQNNNSGNVYDEETQKNKLNNAKQNKMYDKLFVETIQNADLSDDEINKEYEAYLKDPKKYSETFETNSLGKIKNSLSGNNTSKAKPKTESKPKKETQKENGKSEYEREMNKILDEKGYLDTDDIKSLSKYSTKIGSESRNNSSKSNNDIEKEQLELYKKKMNETLDKKGHITPSDMEKWNKEIESETGHKIKTGQEKAKEAKATKKEEKKEIKAAQKEVEKNLKGGLVSNWALLNKAMKEAGITDQKNMTAADWNRVNEEIKKLRNK